MTDTFDPVELFDSLPPLPGWNEQTDLATDTQAAAIFDRIISGNVVPFRPPRRRLKVVTGVVVTFALGGAAAAAIWQRSADEDQAVTCWSDPTVPPETRVAASWGGDGDPIERCAEPWTDGRLGTLGPPEDLRACVNDEGAVAVIPGGEDVCARVGFAPFVPGAPSTGEDANLDAFEHDLNARYNSAACLTVDVVADGARELIRQYGLDGWDVTTPDTTRVEEPCASTAVDRETTTVFVRSRARPD